MNTINNVQRLQPLKKWHERKTFATDTLKIIKSRLQYYRRVLNEEPSTDKQKRQHEKIKNKYEIYMKRRQLLHRAINNLYEL